MLTDRREMLVLHPDDPSVPARANRISRTRTRLAEHRHHIDDGIASVAARGLAAGDESSRGTVMADSAVRQAIHPRDLGSGQELCHRQEPYSQHYRLSTVSTDLSVPTILGFSPLPCKMMLKVGRLASFLRPLALLPAFGRQHRPGVLAQG